MSSLCSDKGGSALDVSASVTGSIGSIIPETMKEEVDGILRLHESIQSNENKNRIEKELETVNGNFLVMLCLNEANYFDTVMELLELVQNRGVKGVYITASRPYKCISNEMQKRNIHPDNTVFIDCISAMVGGGDSETGNCIFVENPVALEEISMHITSLLNGMESNKKFLIMDSISSFLIYNGIDSIKAFSMYLINKLRLDGVDGIIMVTEKKERDDLTQLLIAMCDKVIYI